MRMSFILINQGSYILYDEKNEMLKRKFQLLYSLGTKDKEYKLSTKQLLFQRDNFKSSESSLVILFSLIEATEEIKAAGMIKPIHVKAIKLELICAAVL